MSAGTVTAEQAARALVDRAKEVALCLDFDGTLSPVVDDPEAARPLQGVVEMLGPLASRFAAVAIISGRPAAYLGEHGAAPGVRYLGLYGLQEMHDGRIRVDPRLEAARPTVADMPAFTALTELAAQGHDVLRVAVRSEESPAQLLAAADLVVQGPDEVREFLRRLAV